MERMSVPIAVEFDTTRRNCANLPDAGGFAVVYQCPECGGLLCIWLGSKEKHCHNCGVKLNWNVIMYINSRQSYMIINDDNDEHYKNGLLRFINKRNKEGFDSEVFIMEN